jgi:tetratricopeptide (TPR) repeat protein
MQEEFSKIELLLKESRDARYRDPARMVFLGEMALAAAGRLRPSSPGALIEVSDCRARVWAELGNAYRLADRLSLSERAMGRALRHFEEGSHDSRLLALIADRLAALLCHRREFPEAFALLDRLFEYYQASGQLHLAGRTLITRGLYTEYAGVPKQAIALTIQGLDLIAPREDPTLYLAAIHNLLWFSTELGWFEAVDRLLPQVRHLYGRDELNLLRLRWIEGRVAAGIGSNGEAESILREVREGFAAKNLVFPAALVSLDLILGLLPQRRTAEIAELAGEMVFSFKALRAGRETILTLMLLWRASEQDQVSITELKKRVLAARSALRQAEWRPA